MLYAAVFEGFTDVIAYYYQQLYNIYAENIGDLTDI